MACNGLNATYSAPDAGSVQTDATPPKAEPDVAQEDAAAPPAPPSEDLAVKHIWTPEELATLLIGTPGVVRTVLHGFDITELPVTLAGHADIVLGGSPYHLYHGAVDESGKNPWKKWGGAAAGMSGSPILIQDETGTARIASALSYGLSLPEPVEPFQFGATPAHLMAQIDGESAAYKPGSMQNGSGMQPLGLIALSGGEQYLELYADTLAQRGIVPSIPLAASASVRHIDEEDIPPLVPGSSIAIPLIMPSGDNGILSLAAIGTVTMLDSQHIWAFGHPMGLAGEVSLPYTAAWIDSTFGDVTYAFKYGVSVGPILGTITEDRNAAIVGVRGDKPKTIPMSTKVTYQELEQSFKHLLADTSKTPSIAYLPQNIGLAMLIPVDTVVDQFATEATTVAKLQVHVAGSSVPAEFRIVSSAFAPNFDIFIQTIMRLEQLMNGWGGVTLEKVESEVWYKDGLQIVELSHLELPDTIEPGDPLTITLHYVLHGTWELQSQSFTLMLPEDLPPGAPLTVRVGPKYHLEPFDLDADCQPILPQSVTEWVEHFNSRQVSADMVEVSVETPNTELDACLKSCDPLTTWDPESGEPPPEMDPLCPSACTEQFKCAPPTRVVDTWTVPDHVILGEKIETLMTSPSLP